MAPERLPFYGQVNSSKTFCAIIHYLAWNSVFSLQHGYVKEVPALNNPSSGEAGDQWGAVKVLQAGWQQAWGLPFLGQSLAGWSTSGNSLYRLGPGFPSLNIKLMVLAIAATLQL